jgi:CheY-like chemotaxis protein
VRGYVLIVDEHVATRETLRISLEREGLTIGEVSDGRAALDAVRAQAPDVIVLDLDLTGPSGVEVLTSLKTDPATSWIHVIAVTAGGGEGREHASALGADAYYERPIDPGAVVSSIEGFLSEPPEGA